MATASKIEDLEVWRKSLDLYRLILPLFQRIKIKGDIKFAYQVKSAAGSIMDNIAEGFGRKGRLEFIHSLSIANGECSEIISQLYRAKEEHYCTEAEFSVLHQSAVEVTIKISNFIKYLNGTELRGIKYKNKAGNS